jgi:hypothetical protein
MTNKLQTMIERNTLTREWSPNTELLDTYAWPGGYPMFYVTKDNGVLCPKCANDNSALCLATPDSEDFDPQWALVDFGVNWEDTDLYCDHCNKRIESAYAEDDTE